MTTEMTLPLTGQDIINFKKAKNIFRAIDNPLRRRMLDHLHQHGKTTVTDLYVALRLDQSFASQNLAILRHAGYVTTTKEGKYVFYSLNYDEIDRIKGLATSLIGIDIQ
jgi:DNA-binding transcriptional ArsR family regulator